MHDTTGNDIVDQGFRRLEQLLEDQRRLYQALDALVARQRTAVQRADVADLVAASTQERELVEAIRTLDQKRLELAGAIAGRIRDGEQARHSSREFERAAGRRTTR